MNLGEVIKNFRHSHKLSMDKFSEMSGLTKGYISMLEKNENPGTGKEISPSLDTIKQVADAIKVDFTDLLKMLDKKQMIDISSPPQNLIKLQSKKIPLLGAIAAGKPILAEENINEYIDVDTLTKADFCLRIQGDSMVNAGINDGDVVFIREQEDVENGEIAAVLIGDIDTYETVATLKRVYKTDHGVQLVSENPKYPPMFFNSENSVSIRIIGKATHLLCNVK